MQPDGPMITTMSHMISLFGDVTGQEDAKSRSLAWNCFPTEVLQASVCREHVTGVVLSKVELQDQSLNAWNINHTYGIAT